MAARHSVKQREAGRADAARLVVGLIWLAGAAFNALVTARMSNAYAWLEESPVPLYRWFFGDVVGANPTRWTVLLVIGELSLGILTLARGGWARLGLAGGALFSALLFSFGTVYTLIMGPYALLLAWLARKRYGPSPLDRLRTGLARRSTGHA